MFSRRRKSGATCTSAGRVTAQVLLSFLAFGALPSAALHDDGADAQIVLPIGASPIAPLKPEPPAPAEHTFTLRHIYHHGTYRQPALHRKYDVTQSDAQVWLAAEDERGEQRLPPLKAKSHATRIERLVDRRPSVVDPMVATARQRGYVSVLAPHAWTLDDIPGPNITDKETVLSFAYMASNAYVEKPGQADWHDVGPPFNKSEDFGWETDGIRGHVWADEGNRTIVIGLKGTSPAVFDGDGTTTNDKENDNLFFSCCCAQQGPWTWHQVCNCATGTYSCNNTCVTQALREEHRYYQAARELYSNVTELYPNSNVWLTGHSLGGAVSSLLGLTYGLPAVTFEAVPEALPAKRLGLPVPPGADPDTPQARQYTGAYHFGHTADPIYVGTCNGATASCSLGGYAMESACHTGHECTYDTVADHGWRVGIGTHKIRAVINDVLLKYDTVPPCVFTPECRDCAAWKMYESNGTDSTTTASSSTPTKTRTRTQTCETPGWWGCLDESTTATATATATPTMTTATCQTPGWFGCKDKTSTVSSVTTTPVTPTPTPTTPVTPTTTCATPGRFWGCWDPTPSPDPTTPAAHHAITPPPTATPTTAAGLSTSDESEARCLARYWFGLCREWSSGGSGKGMDEI